MLGLGRLLLIAIIIALLGAASAFGEASIYELRVTNNSSKDLTFRLNDGHSKHAKLTYNKKKVTEHTIKAGTSDVVGVQPTGDRCSTNCGACNPTIGKVYAWYTDSNGNEVRNNYYRPKLEWYEYCAETATGAIKTYTTNWSFDHGGGQGTNLVKHDQSSKHNSYTTKSPSTGLTFDAKYINGHTTITYSDK